MVEFTVVDSGVVIAWVLLAGFIPVCRVRMDKDEHRSGASLAGLAEFWHLSFSSALLLLRKQA
jgi:hypothetical protein